MGIVGRPDLGMVAAAEAGLALERVALVPAPGADLVAVTMALLDGMDIVAVAPDGPAAPFAQVRSGPPVVVRAAERQRLAARARQRGAVLVALGPWQGADLELHCSGRAWTGLTAGRGRLRSCATVVRRGGRGSPGAPGKPACSCPAPRDGRARGGSGAGGCADPGGGVREHA